MQTLSGLHRDASAEGRPGPRDSVPLRETGLRPSSGSGVPVLRERWAQRSVSGRVELLLRSRKAVSGNEFYRISGIRQN